ncbi:AcrR family transcriptional regulator [Lipingzhangella halophila]|uniref:AcrR family transcriptional regulator n=1 Tax=Lipingzhangella halophila TaxID=1783352 RepID=A0A7W7RH41_9ACTN|nr:TetR/AcrR family transcriptional regulator [Lipingzhangella halophila]MBB4931762.1 AcrR family transcriptional regulator [Lipingzhangella halophila]
MGRPGRFTEDQILGAALEVVAAHGPAAATVSAIAAHLGAPVGSIYHRFASRDLLLARLWTRGVRRFQAGFLEALQAGDAERAALHTPRWCRESPNEARVLLLYRREDVAARWPEELGPEMAALATSLQSGLRTFAAEGGHDLQRVMFALVDVPHGAVRRYLSRGEAPPESVDSLIAETCRAVLGTP